MVNDLLTKIREEQDSPFKSATPEDLEARKEARKQEIIAKRGKKDLCPHCGADLREEGVYGDEQTWGTVSKYWDESAEGWEWGDSDTNTNEIDVWHCNACDGEIEEGTDFDIRESKTPFKPASKAELKKRGAKQHVKITSIDQLKQLASGEDAIDVVIALNYGLRSTKRVSYEPETDTWWILNYVDSSETSRLEDTNIQDAIEKGALWLDEAKSPFQPASKSEVAKRLDAAEEMIRCPKCRAKVFDERPEYLNQSFEADEAEEQYECPKCGELFSSSDVDEAKTPFVPAGPEELAKRKKEAPLLGDDFEWYSQLQDIITGYKAGSTDPLDGDEVDRVTELIRLKLNYMEGNITLEEYLHSPIGD